MRFIVPSTDISRERRCISLPAARWSTFDNLWSMGMRNGRLELQRWVNSAAPCPNVDRRALLSSGTRSAATTMATEGSLFRDEPGRRIGARNPVWGGRSRTTDRVIVLPEGPPPPGEGPATAKKPLIHRRQHDPFRMDPWLCAVYASRLMSTIWAAVNEYLLAELRGSITRSHAVLSISA